MNIFDDGDKTSHELLHHGGRLHAAAEQYGIALADWLDLSTGINPCGWPVPEVPARVWARLPEDDDDLVQAAREYYRAEHLLPVAGSQAAIQSLPRLRPPSRVGVLHPGYAEHAAGWRRAGHAVTPVEAGQLHEAVDQSDVIVLIHPNNPTGERFATEQLLEWHERLVRRGGWLIVDEAFMDAAPELSLCPIGSRPGLIVLRSLGKFFGLAGVRVGFVCAWPDLLSRLAVVLGPWSVGNPSRWVASTALKDKTWQQAERLRLCDEETRLKTLLTRHDLAPSGGCALFQWIKTEQASYLHDNLARLGILTRLFSEPSSLRFGLPGDEADWRKLDEALSRINSRVSAGIDES